MNILITSVSKKTILINLFREVLTTTELHGNVIGIDLDDSAIGLKFCDKFYKVCKMSDNNYLEEIIKICEIEDIKLIIPTRDVELLYYAKHKDIFFNKNIKVCVSSYETVELCNNKKKFIEYCMRENFPIPKTYNNIKDVEYPFFIKPINGQASQDIHIIKNSDELLFYDFDKYVIQEYINYDEFTVDYLGDFDGNFIGCVVRKRISVINGESQITQTCKCEEIEKICENIGNKLKLIGHCNIQCFYNGVNIKLIEINPRFGGASHLGIRAGLDSPKKIVEMCLGKENKKVNINNNLKMYRYNYDVFFDYNNNQNNKIYCVDIDGTLCTEGSEYELSKPIKKIIDKVNLLYDNGNTIILNTARGYKSGIDWSELTEKQLKEWGVKYHKLIMKKPFADYYIDNKAINVFDWI